MWSIEQRGGTYGLKKSGKVWASIISGVLLAAWLIAAIGVAVAADPYLYPYLLVWTIVLVLPAWIISRTLGQTQHRHIAAVVSAQEAMGGTVLTVMDHKNERHDIVTTPHIAQAIAAVASSTTSGQGSTSSAPGTPPPLPPTDARPADWYTDPEGKARLRYWDGSQWTDHTAP